MKEMEPLRVWQAAVALGVMPQTVYNMLEDGRLTAFLVAGKKFVMPDEKFGALLDKEQRDSVKAAKQRGVKDV